ncbi:ankyrin [Ascobolus immersus RN42]|uniref:Ankyrin n=1 Tax=Ascobolus immersus RN42 TaxID=1160509 RepID=A0A3N4HW86_ASCIM|nr:ankyrin [Ascobolus immersus RN42]
MVGPTYTLPERAMIPAADGKDHFSHLPLNIHELIAENLEPIYDDDFTDLDWSASGNLYPYVQGLFSLAIASRHLRNIYLRPASKTARGEFISFYIEAALKESTIEVCWKRCQEFVSLVVRIPGLGVEGLLDMLRMIDEDEDVHYVAHDYDQMGYLTAGKLVTGWALVESIKIRKMEFVVALVDVFGFDVQTWVGYISGHHQREAIGKGNARPGVKILMWDAVDVVKVLYERKGFKFWEMKDGSDRTGLHMAVEFGAVECVRYMLEMGADVAAIGGLGWYPVHMACSFEFVQDLGWYGLREYYDIDKPSIAAKRLEILKLLLAQEKKVNLQGRSHRAYQIWRVHGHSLIGASFGTPLDLAIYSGVMYGHIPHEFASIRVEMALALLEAGALASDEERGRSTDLQDARFGDEALLHPGYMYTALTTLSWNTPEDQTLRLLQLLYEGGAKINYQSPPRFDRKTPLHCALHKPTVFKWLIDHGAEPHQFRDASGLTPLNRILCMGDNPVATEAQIDSKIELLRYIAQSGFSFQGIPVESLFPPSREAYNPAERNANWNPQQKERIVSFLMKHSTSEGGTWTEHSTTTNTIGALPTEQSTATPGAGPSADKSWNSATLPNNIDPPLPPLPTYDYDMDENAEEEEHEEEEDDEDEDGEDDYIDEDEDEDAYGYGQPWARPSRRRSKPSYLFSSLSMAPPKTLLPPADGSDRFSALPVELHHMIANCVLDCYGGRDVGHVTGLASLLLSSSYLRRVYFQQVCKIIADTYRTWAWDIVKNDFEDYDTWWEDLVGLTQHIFHCKGLGVAGLVEILKLVGVDEKLNDKFQNYICRTPAELINGYAMETAIDFKSGPHLTALVELLGKEDKVWFGDGTYEEEFVPTPPGRRIIMKDGAEFVKLLHDEVGLRLWEMSDGDCGTGFLMAVELGSINTVRYMLEAGAKIDSTDRSGWHSLNRLCCLTQSYLSYLGKEDDCYVKKHSAENLEILKLLIEKGADINYSGFEEVQHPDYDLDHQRGPLDLLMLTGRSSLTQTMCHFKAAAALELLRAGATASTEDKEGGMCLGYMALVLDWDLPEERLVTVLEALLNGGANIHFKSSPTDETAIHIAAQKALPTVFRWLVEHGADLQALDANKTTPINRLLSFSGFITRPMSVDSRVKKVESRLGILRYIADSGYDFDKDLGVDSLLAVDVVDGRIGTHVHLPAVCKMEKKLVQSIIELGAKIHVNPREGRRRAGACWSHVVDCCLSEEERIDFFKFVLDNGADVDYLRSENDIPLLHACVSKHLMGLAKLLIERGADIGAVDPVSKSTALQYAALLGKPEMVKLLLEAGNNLDVNQTDGKGRSAVHYAVMIESSLEHMAWIQREAIEDFGQKLSNTFLEAVNKRLADKLATLTILHAHGADMNLCIPSRDTPSTSFSFEEVFDRDLFIDQEESERVWQYKLDQKKTREHLPPIAHTLRCPHWLPEICRFNSKLTLHLLSLGAHPHTGSAVHDERGYISWLLSCTTSEDERLRYLRKLIRLLGPGDVNTQTMPDGQTALQKAACHDASIDDEEAEVYCDHRFCKMLVENGADPWKTDLLGWNAVMVAGCLRDKKLAGYLCGDEQEGERWVESRLLWSTRTRLSESEIGEVFEGGSGW